MILLDAIGFDPSVVSSALLDLCMVSVGLCFVEPFCDVICVVRPLSGVT